MRRVVKKAVTIARSASSVGGFSDDENEHKNDNGQYNVVRHECRHPKVSSCRNLRNLTTKTHDRAACSKNDCFNSRRFPVGNSGEARFAQSQGRSPRALMNTEYGRIDFATDSVGLEPETFRE